MELIRGVYNLRDRHRGNAVTIGNFDGVHRGHRAMLDHLRERAAALRVPAMVMTFEPTPQEYFAGDAAPARLSSLRDKCAALAAAGAERLLCVKFNSDFAAMPPQAFIDRLLVTKLDVRYMLVGDDFRFGRDRAGDFAMLEAAGRDNEFEVEAMPTVAADGGRVSSTRVREALAAHNLAAAKRLLGRDYSIRGRVRRGERLGRKLGFPTVNIALGGRVSPVSGIFVVRLHGAAPEPRYGVASVGTRPTVQGTGKLLEVYLYDFDGELYGAHLEVEFLHWLRDEVKFPDVEAMREQIVRDAEAGRNWLASQD